MELKNNLKINNLKMILFFKLTDRILIDGYAEKEENLIKQIHNKFYNVFYDDLELLDNYLYLKRDCIHNPNTNDDLEEAIMNQISILETSDYIKNRLRWFIYHGLLLTEQMKWFNKAKKSFIKDLTEELIFKSAKICNNNLYIFFYNSAVNNQLDVISYLLADWFWHIDIEMNYWNSIVQVA